MQESLENLQYRLLALEKTVGALNGQINEQSSVIQTINDSSGNQVPPGQHNMIRNGDFDLDRNRYIYTTDFSDADPGTVDADVSEEAAHWYTALPDTSIESTGSINNADNTLTLDTPDFISGDAGAEIVVEGAGPGGADLITTIATFTDSTHVELTAAAGATVTNARVRWRLRALAEDSTDEDADADQTTNTTLKTADHSRYSDSGIINDPDYDKENGWARLGSLNWLCAPLPKNYLKPGTVYLPTFIYKLRTAVSGEDSYQITPFLGLWDNSPGKRQFIEGKAIEINAETIGAPVATISREYFIVFYTNWGETIGSEKVTLADAPADGSFVTNSVYVYLSWSQPRGIIRTEIYRKTGSVYKLVGLPNQGSFRDTNGTAGVPQEPQSTVVGYPSVDYLRASALIKTTDKNFNPARTDIWQLAQFSIAVPSDYDKSRTTDKQWLVIGLPEVISEARSIEIDQVSLDDKFGVFSLSPLDQGAERELSSTPTSGNQGNPGGIFIPPGSTGCPTFETPVLVELNGFRQEVAAIELVNNLKGYKIINRRGEGAEFKARVSRTPQIIYELATASHKLRASASHPVFMGDADTQGKALRLIRSGDTITVINGTNRVIYNIRQVKKEYTVQFELTGEEKGFWAGGVGGHNRKETELDFPQNEF